MVVVVLLAGGLAWFKFFRTAPQPEVAATTSSPVPAQTATATPAAIPPPADPGAASQDAAGEALGPSAYGEAGEPPPGDADAGAAMESAPESEPPPPVDPALDIAADLVRKGERAYSRGDYDAAARQASSALDVSAGYVPAEKLLRRAYAAQKKAAEQRIEQQRLAAEQARIAAEQAVAQAQAQAATPTPDDAYNQRAHSECAPGLFGKSCRRKIRAAVCAGVQPGSPGATVCKDTN